MTQLQRIVSMSWGDLVGGCIVVGALLLCVAVSWAHGHIRKHGGRV